MFRSVPARWAAAVSSVSIASLRFNSSIISSPSTTPERGPNLLKEPSTPLKRTITPSDSSIIKTDDNTYNNKDSSTRYSVQPPVAKQQATYTRMPWDTTVDNYAWLRDQEAEETISYLKAENAYTEYKTKHTKDLQKLLYTEILTRIVEDDSSVPAKRDQFLYYKRTASGKPYAIYCRKFASPSKQQKGEEEILLDVNALAEGKEFMSLGSYNISPDHKLLAYSTDDEGNEVYNLVFKDLATNKLVADRIENIASMEWCNDNKTILYTKHDTAWRPYQLWKHRLGTDVGQDELVFQEDDARFTISIERTRDDKFMILHVGSAITDEVWVVDADRPDTFTCVAEREQGVEYVVEHQGDEFLILINDDGAVNFQLYAVSDGLTEATQRNKWHKIIEHDEDVTLKSVECFKDFVVIKQQKGGLSEYRIRYQSASNTRNEHIIELPEASYSISYAPNLEYDTNTFRFNYTSLITPSTTYDYDISSQSLESLKIKPVNDYDSCNYQTKRVWATSMDGTRVPISLIARKDIDLSNTNANPSPIHLTGYGSYGYPYDVYFSAARLSLVDRGVVVAYAHIRGGGEFGRKWKLDGKLDKKMNTFQDFIACSQHLIDLGLTSNKQLVASGGSAGGLLMGAVMNMRSDLFHAVIADVPFVDVLNSILDESLPLTAGEWEEWGDPRTMRDYFTIKSYSPYDNVSTQKYPNVLIEGGLNDTRVKYWEPAKFAAKLREFKRLYGGLYDRSEEDNVILLKTNMGAGHGGSSGRYGRIKEIAFEYAFLLDQLGMQDTPNPNLHVEVESDDKGKEKE